MSLACSAYTCFSNHTDQVDGRSIKFYSFPNDEKLKAQWKTICRSICASVTKENSFRLCELHFEKNSFAENMQLKSNAVPTIFDHPNKRKMGHVFQRFENPILRPPAKRHKSEHKDENISEGKDKIFFTSTSLKVKADPQKSLTVGTQTLNDPLSSEIKTKGPFHYRLIIQIDKIRARPGPKSKKLLRSTGPKNKLKNSTKIQKPLKESSQKSCNKAAQNKLIEPYQSRLNDLEESRPKRSVPSILKKSNQNNSNTVQKSFQKLINSSAHVPRCETGCQLEKVIWDTNPAFKCQKCNNIYIPKPIPESNVFQSNNICNQCVTCKKTFPTSEMLYSHMKEHLTCDICYCLFKTEFEYNNHMGLHTSVNPSTPFQCHLCDVEFSTRISIRNHVSVVHMMKPKGPNQQVSQEILPVVYQCKICNLIFNNNENLRIHMDSHKEKNGSVVSVGQLKLGKFFCSICSMEFSTLPEIDAHIKTHTAMNVEDLRCNICRRVFKNDRILSDHLREHVARAHRCHLCPKAFINKAALQNHLQNHV